MLIGCSVSAQTPEAGISSNATIDFANSIEEMIMTLGGVSALAGLLYRNMKEQIRRARKNSEGWERRWEEERKRYDECYQRLINEVKGNRELGEKIYKKINGN